MEAVLGGLKRKFLAGELLHHPFRATGRAGGVRRPIRQDHPARSAGQQISARRTRSSARWRHRHQHRLHRIGAGFFGGEGFILQKLEGTGVFMHSGGTIVPMTSRRGRSVDTGCLAFDDVDYDIVRVGGIKTSLFGGEGLFFASLTGRRVAPDAAVLGWPTASTPRSEAIARRQARPRRHARRPRRPDRRRPKVATLPVEVEAARRRDEPEPGADRTMDLTPSRNSYYASGERSSRPAAAPSRCRRPWKSTRGRGTSPIRPAATTKSTSSSS